MNQCQLRALALFIGALILVSCETTPSPKSTPEPAETTPTQQVGLRPRALESRRPATPAASESLSPAAVSATDRSAVVQVANGENHACALRGTGQVECWGSNDQGQLDVPEDARFQQVTSGWRFSCGIQKDGSLRCWGRNNHQQAEPPAGRFSTVDAGWDHACGIRGTAAICWGRNANDRAAAPRRGEFTAIGAGAEHSCGLSTTGRLVCWGKNDNGRADSRDGPFRALTVGIAHTCVLRGDGTPFCQGANDAGQSSPPVAVFTHISAGHDHTCGSLPSGYLMCWGGQPADAPASGIFAPSGRFTSLSTGWQTACALDAQADIICWSSAHIVRPPSRFQHVQLDQVAPESLFSSPTDVAPWPSGLVIAERKGEIVRLTPEMVVEPIVDLTAVVDANGGEKGLLSLAVDPQFTDHAYIYVYYTRTSDDDPPTTFARLSRFPVIDGRASADGERVILDIGRHTQSTRHWGGAIRFGPDGLLYLGIGDAGCLDCPQDLRSLHGKILRIDVRDASPAQPYRAPDSNPFVDVPEARPEVWAYGLRNPWRMSFDSTGERLWVADVGSHFQEEVTVARPGANLGWPRIEGTLCTAVAEFESLSADALESHESIYDSPCKAIHDVARPIMTYAARHHGNCAIIGGIVYGGASMPWLAGTYLFGDYCSGRIWALADDVDAGWRMVQMADLEHPIISFGVDGNGELLVLTHDGPIYRLAEAVLGSAPSVTHRPLVTFSARR
ncbi:MAG: PQQ-dependent sugar dehydrogenase [Chloroflexota bacterium]|nr:PQQ-dependent sugar dehydrogenase [Chloroflexota bacterium]